MPVIDGIDTDHLWYGAEHVEARSYSWYDQPYGVKWESTEAALPDEGDEASCEECSEEIIYKDDEWKHKKLSCEHCGEDIVEDNEGVWHLDDDSGSPLCEEASEPLHEPDEDHDPEPDDEWKDAHRGDGPVMNYWYPVELNDLEEAAQKIVHLPLCIVQVRDDEDDEWETGLALTGGGMDFSWEICEAFIRLGYAPPLHFADLPGIAGKRLTDRNRLILEGCRVTAKHLTDQASRVVEKMDKLEQELQQNGEE